MGQPDLYIQVLGADQLQRIFGQSQEAFEKRALVDANKKAAQIIVEKALPNVPVGKTGRLKASVKASATAKKANVRAGTPSRVPYAAAIHWGRDTGNTNFKHGRYAKGLRPLQGRPFLWNAKQEALDSGELEDAYSEACNDLINRFF